MRSCSSHCTGLSSRFKFPMKKKPSLIFSLGEQKRSVKKFKHSFKPNKIVKVSTNSFLGTNSCSFVKGAQQKMEKQSKFSKETFNLELRIWKPVYHHQLSSNPEGGDDLTLIKNFIFFIIYFSAMMNSNQWGSI